MKRIATTAVAAAALAVGVGTAGAGGNGHGPASVTQTVAEALAGLGYSTEEARDALREVASDADASTVLRDALKVLAVRRT